MNVEVSDIIVFSKSNARWVSYFRKPLCVTERLRQESKAMYQLGHILNAAWSGRCTGSTSAKTATTTPGQWVDNARSLGIVADNDIHPSISCLLTRDALPNTRSGLVPTSGVVHDLDHESMTGTSIRTPTTVASAAPELNPKRLIAAATANSKKLLAPMSADGAATQCASPVARFRR